VLVAVLAGAIFLIGPSGWSRCTRRPVTCPPASRCEAGISWSCGSACRRLHSGTTFDPVVFLVLPVVILFALYPGFLTLSQLAR
jgi:hypothetical protein